MNDGIYWVQASYDTRDDSSQWCNPHDDAALCLCAIDTSSGDLINSTLSNSYTIYNVSRTEIHQGTKILAVLSCTESEWDDLEFCLWIRGILPTSLRTFRIREFESNRCEHRLVPTRLTHFLFLFTVRRTSCLYIKEHFYSRRRMD